MQATAFEGSPDTPAESPSQQMGAAGCTTPKGSCGAECVGVSACGACRRRSDHSLPVVQSRVELILPRQTLVDMRLLRQDVSPDRKHHAHQTNLETGNKQRKEKRHKAVSTSTKKSRKQKQKTNKTAVRRHNLSPPLHSPGGSYLYSNERHACHAQDSEVPQTVCLKVRVRRGDLALLEGQTGPSRAHRFVQPQSVAVEGEETQQQAGDHGYAAAHQPLQGESNEEPRRNKQTRSKNLSSRSLSSRMCVPCSCPR